MSGTEIGRRHYRDRPLSKLTDPELMVIEEVYDSLSRLLREPERARLGELADLANREGAERTFHRESGRRINGT